MCVEDTKRNKTTKYEVKILTWSDVTTIYNRYFLFFVKRSRERVTTKFKYLNDIWRASSTP